MSDAVQPSPASILVVDDDTFSCGRLKLAVENPGSGRKLPWTDDQGLVDRSPAAAEATVAALLAHLRAR